MKLGTLSFKFTPEQEAAVLLNYRRARMTLAARLVTQYATDYAEYEQDARESTRGGYRNRLGHYRVHYCEHGTSRWTDYDNICGPCEAGITMGDPYQRHVRALADSAARIIEFARLTDLRVSLTDEGLGHVLDLAPLRDLALKALDPATPFRTY